MFFTRFLSIFVFFASFRFVVSVALNTAVQERQENTAVNDAVVAILNTLKTSTDTILPQINSIAQSGNASDATVTPLIDNLVTALDAAYLSLTSLETSSGEINGQSDDAITNLIVGIATDIANSRNSLSENAASVPSSGDPFSNVDTSLFEVLRIIIAPFSAAWRWVAGLFSNSPGTVSVSL